jgi:hypothetical protein
MEEKIMKPYTLHTRFLGKLPLEKPPRENQYLVDFIDKILGSRHGIMTHPRNNTMQ